MNFIISLFKRVKSFFLRLISTKTEKPVNTCEPVREEPVSEQAPEESGLLITIYNISCVRFIPEYFNKSMELIERLRQYGGILEDTTTDERLAIT